MPESIENFAASKKIEIKELQSIIQKCKEKLLKKRAERIRPQLDDKILLGWNALMNAACSKAYAALEIDEYKQLAVHNLQFIEEKMQQKNDSFFHTFKNNIAKIDAFLDDYAYLIQSYIHLQEITGNGDYLIKAKSITTFVIKNFGEAETGYFYYTHAQQQDVIVRKKEVYDGATPSGNAIMALNLYYLSIVFDIPDWYQRSLKMCESLSNAIIKYPTSFGCWASAFQLNFHGTKEIAVVGNGSGEYLPAILKNYLPNKILQSTNVKNSIFPLFKGKFNDEMLSFYVCKNYICSRPMYEIGEFLQICNT